ncbi:sensor histidine kinase [Rhizobium sp. C4]|uniref:sensor histidine kinase n=1 Tax=Rhizobium sp. C4 TaxID=1349800 RepID=UPI001E4E1DC7|nr:histidine kinase dimerization/phosphoacceptor domain -containing protein [Rhizobium sp. C4]MCD2173379.1 response regulator [Rhizobium sp. C4]
MNHEVIHAHDPDDAFEKLQNEVFDVVVLDHYLSNMTGLDILRRFREFGISTPVVYVTGSSEARIAVEALKNGASDYVIKNASEDFLSLLADAVVNTVANARLRKAKELADEETRRAKERAEALLAEMNHRVANSLALVTSLLRLQASAAQHEETRQVLQETQSRISAIAGMHRSLYSNDKISTVDMKPYIGALVGDLSDTVSGPESRLRISAHLDEIELAADKAVSVGMIVTELVTNALKYAYPEGEAGEIRIIFKRVDATNARLAVEDDGAGLASSSEAKPGNHKTGLGTRIVRSMADSIGNGIQYPPTDRGTVAEVLVLLEG